MSRRRMYAELTAAAALVAISVLTVVWPEWIERIFGLDPDAGSGAAEAVTVIASALAAGALWGHRRRALRRSATQGGRGAARDGRREREAS